MFEVKIRVSDINYSSIAGNLLKQKHGKTKGKIAELLLRPIPKSVKRKTVISAGNHFDDTLVKKMKF